MIQHVFKKYDEQGAVMTANVITYRPKSAFREMSRVLSFPPSFADRFSQHGGEFLPEGPVENEKDKKPIDFEERMTSLLPPKHPLLPALAELYEMALGMPRHLGQHCGGMIVCDRGLDAVVPLQRATMPGRTVVQWDKDALNDLSLIGHRRDALWQVELPLYGDLITGRREGDFLNMITPAERLAADFSIQGPQPALTR